MMAASAADMLDTLGPDELLADGACDSHALKRVLPARGAYANSKSFANRECLPAFNAFFFRYGNLVDRLFGKLKQSRAVATHYDKRDGNFLALARLASMRIRLRHNKPVA